MNLLRPLAVALSLTLFTTRLLVACGDNAPAVTDTTAQPRDTSAPDIELDTSPTLDTDTAPDVSEPDTEPADTEPADTDTDPALDTDTAPSPETDTAPELDTAPARDTAPDTAPDTTETTDATDATDATDVTDTVSTTTDRIFGTDVERADSWWVSDGRIHHKTQVVRLRGINWFGLETTDRALHGLWFGRKVESFLVEIRGLGFDALRIPLSPESINPGFTSASWAQGAFDSGPATTGREHLERLIATATDFALLLDFHTCSPTQIGGTLPGRPDGCPGYDADRWLADLTTLATLAIGHEHVVGIDLTNEPHALTWSQWRSLAERGAEAVLRANPRLLVFVEGVAGASEYGANYPFWGENLTEAGTSPPNIPASRLVLSPHVYGPGIAQQSYFSAGNFPANMPAIWRTHFGHLVPSRGFAVGEFGGHYDDAKGRGEVAWNDAFVAYLATLDRGQPASFFYWAVNANSGDTGGLYLDDWITIDQRRVTLLAPLLAP